jgi:hypothetical protein
VWTRARASDGFAGLYRGFVLNATLTGVRAITVAVATGAVRAGEGVLLHGVGNDRPLVKGAAAVFVTLTAVDMALLPLQTLVHRTMATVTLSPMRVAAPFMLQQALATDGWRSLYRGASTVAFRNAALAPLVVGFEFLHTGYGTVREFFGGVGGGGGGVGGLRGGGGGGGGGGGAAAAADPLQQRFDAKKQQSGT